MGTCALGTNSSWNIFKYPPPPPPPKKSPKNNVSQICLLYFSRILRLILIIFICSHASNHISIEIVYFISPYLIIVIVCFSNTYIDKFIQNSKAYLDCLIIKKVRSSYVNVFVSLYVLSLINIVWLSIIPYINSGSKKETWNMVRKWHTARFVWKIRDFETDVTFYNHRSYQFFYVAKSLFTLW